jgi:peptide/nickel transport system ATP-binding protein
MGQDLLALPEERRRFRGTQVAYVAQSAQAAFNPVHRLMDQIVAWSPSTAAA